MLPSRNQLVLDLSRPEVSDYLFGHMSDVLSAHAVSYVKWDMNRDLTHVGGQAGRAMTSAQTRAVYALMARVRKAFPDVEIESCASGGGRVDYGVLRHTQRVWTSDCTDAFERLEIQRGASMCLRPNCWEPMFRPHPITRPTGYCRCLSGPWWRWPIISAWSLIH